MDYTVDQVRDAIDKKRYEELEKGIALLRHENALKTSKEVNLPYRVMLDYYKARERHDQGNNEVDINTWYPHPKIPKVADLSKEERTPKREYELKANGQWIETVTELTGEISKEGVPYVGFCECKDEQWRKEKVIINEMARKRAEPYRPWDLETSEGLKKWEKYFAVFVASYEHDIATWNKFNMFGDAKHTDEELNERRAYYEDLVRRYNADTENYFDKAPRTMDGLDLSQYDLSSK